MALSKSWLRVLSGLFVNLAASWIAAAFITPAFINLPFEKIIFLLTRYLGSATICLLLAEKIESMLENL